MDSQVDSPRDLVEEASSAFLGQWSRLVSTTNWEKGRIIHQWRAALEEAGAGREEVSDEAWSRRVGNVSSQHVGRLRRVWERFGEVREQYAGLYWSHFQSALDWHNAEMWLEGAVQNGWSISQMRLKRWEVSGEAEEAPGDVEPAEELDQDFSPAHDPADRSPARETPDAFPDFAGRERAEDETHEAADAGAVPFDAADWNAPPADQSPVRPFAALAALPADVQDALESFKLAIVRHKLAGWTEVARDDVLAALDALRALALAPAE